jgi:hypothetical protein
VHIRKLEKRIKQLGDKANQLLLFLSFAFVVAAILETTGDKLERPRMFLTFGVRCWAAAIFPIPIGVLPIKEIRERCENWYNIVRWSKFALLWAPILSIIIGTLSLCAPSGGWVQPRGSKSYWRKQFAAGGRRFEPCHVHHIPLYKCSFRWMYVSGVFPG